MISRTNEGIHALGYTACHHNDSYPYQIDGVALMTKSCSIRRGSFFDREVVTAAVGRHNALVDTTVPSDNGS